MDRAYKSILAGGEDQETDIADVDIPVALSQFPVKFWWFATRPEPYMPHSWQTLFHAANLHGHLRRYRHLVAGRRGGKTLSAAWEVLFYALYPEQFHRDLHQKESTRALWVWALSKDYQAGRPSLRTFIEVLNAAGLKKDVDYTFNKAQQVFEFIESGSVVEFKTASDPQSLRGAGLDILWIDEAAFIPNKDAWNVVRMALGDKQGMVITTTTPWGKNWFYEEFFQGEVLGDERHFRVEYTSVDNPYFPKEEWDYARTHLHPVIFAQEHLAAFDAMAGVALSGDWLKYYVYGNPDTRGDDISIPREGDRYKLRMYIGIDPAVSIADDADDFAMAVIGVTHDGDQAFLVDYYLGHIPFPEQVDKIAEWHLKWRPEMIGVESNAFQRALEQQASRLPGMPPVVPVFAKGKKEERILAMGPMFKLGKVRVRQNQGEFIDQWVSFDPEQKNQKDDLLDAVEIALGVANVLLPAMPHADNVERPTSLEDHAREHIRAAKRAKQIFDPDLGDMA
ncbi:MAG TPA: phage terminase large subunit [Flavobacteriales bacterium]|nr:phage terminase large subunit [Flavobacteriales bacterium]